MRLSGFSGLVWLIFTGIFSFLAACGPAHEIRRAESILASTDLDAVRAWCTSQLLISTGNPSAASIAAEDVPKDIRQISTEVVVCNDKAFDAGKEHVLFIMRSGFCHSAIRIGNRAFVPTESPSVIRRQYAPGVWIEADK